MVEGLEAMPILEELQDEVSLNEHSLKRSHQGDAFLEFPHFDNFSQQPFHFSTIETYQQQDEKLQEQLQVNTKHYFTQQLDSTTLICFLATTLFQTPQQLVHCNPISHVATFGPVVSHHYGTHSRHGPSRS